MRYGLSGKVCLGSYGYGRRVVGLLLAACLLLLAAGSAASSVSKRGTQHRQTKEVRELWTGSMFTSTMRIGICFFDGDKLRGVVHLRQRNGAVDVYHIYGGVHGEEFWARHGSGHTFTGRLVSDDVVDVRIRLKNGMRLRMEGRREHYARLAEDDCAPLP